MSEPAYPQFPQQQCADGTWDQQEPEPGMMLSDYFAAHALPGLLAAMLSRHKDWDDSVSGGFDNAACVEAARLAWITSEAMIEMRKESGK